LGAVVLVGALDFTIRASFATNVQPPQLASAASPQTEPAPAAIAAEAMNSPGSAGPKVIKVIEIASKPSDNALSVAKPDPLVGFALVPVSYQASQLALDADEEVQQDHIPLPTKKPVPPSFKTVKATSTTVATKKRAMRVQREPKPIPFGVIGFNYSDPAR
jgi:hypothetical protein